MKMILQHQFCERQGARFKSTTGFQHVIERDSTSWKPVLPYMMHQNRVSLG